MGGIAQLAKAMGFKVSGCDAGVYPPMSDQLQQAGIHLIEGYSPDQLTLGADLYVIGNAISRGNPLLEAILNQGLPYTSGPQWLSENILVNKHAGLNPSFLVGGVPQNFGCSARLTDSKFFVIEADEYDTAFFDKRSKFVHYRPRTAILNNLEYDHADIFSDLAAIERQFHHLVRTIPSEGKVIFNNKSEALRRVLAMGLWTPAESFGLEEDADWRLVDHEGWRVSAGGKELGWMQLDLPGEHNRLNALAAVAAATTAGVSTEEALDALTRFHGVKRRMEVKGEVGGIRVIDDFAHHPTAIEETIRAVAAKTDGGRVIAVFEPRSNTMKLGAVKQALAPSLSQAAQVFAFQGPSVSWDIQQALRPIEDKTHVYKDLHVLAHEAAAAVNPKDIILVMSNGSFGGVHGMILDELKARFGQKA